ncbi:BTAD domain-containing putative transcriptional regulator [Streptomyces sp. NPDC018031]|uniref:AfsR/SARP family transcriptional regulator n=1 Tax=Streptomyces sp. NPDC018031 TaxID=3365033 RepID=UPI0037AC023A
MRYEILCPLRVVDGSSITSLSARKIEVLLAALLVRTDETVSSEDLIKEIWGNRAPRQALAALHVYVSQLRKFLRRPGRTDSPIVTARGGYALRLGSDELDFRVFQDLVRLGGDAQRAGCVQEACEAYEEGLGLWHGPVLEDLRDGAIVNGFVCWAEQARLDCVERFVETGLELGRHREFVSYLYARIEELPLHEAFYRQLMLALHRSGCRADALGVYQSARTVLSEELGLEPSTALKRLHHAILVDAPELEVV